MERSDNVGMEFDWFAVDQDGNFALFATAGAGPVPEQVFDALDCHGDILDDIPVVGWGTKHVWDSYARVGLFAYDWRDALGAYVRVAAPTQRLDLPFTERLRASSLPKLKVSFVSESAVRLPVDSTS